MAFAPVFSAGGIASAALSGMTSTTILGGAGNDVIGTISYTNWANVTSTGTTALTIGGSFLDGGDGNDTITFLLDSATLTGATFQGGAGNDVIGLRNENGRAQQFQFFAGGGNDRMSGTFSAVSGSTFAGGGGNDTITITASAAITNLGIYLDAANQASQFDGNDLFTGGFSGSASGITLQAGAGNDTVTINFSAGADNNNLFQFALGNDVLSANTMSAATIQAGAGNDLVNIDSGFVSSTMILGGGDDTFQFFGSGNAGTGGVATGLSASTIFGGAGADLISATATIGSGTTVNAVFGYDAASESTLSAMDTIGIGGSGTIFSVRYNPGSLTLASVSGSAGSFTATNGSVVFTGTFASDVTSRVTQIAAVASAGQVYSFVDGNNINYLMVAGTSAADAMVARFGYTGGVASGGTLSLGGGGKNITLGLAGQR